MCKRFGRILVIPVHAVDLGRVRSISGRLTCTHIPIQRALFRITDPVGRIANPVSGCVEYRPERYLGTGWCGQFMPVTPRRKQRVCGGVESAIKGRDEDSDTILSVAVEFEVRGRRASGTIVYRLYLDCAGR